MLWSCICVTNAWPTLSEMASTLTYEGCNFLRQRLILATLSGRPVKIKKIRSKDDNPGLRGMRSI